MLAEEDEDVSKGEVVETESQHVEFVKRRVSETSPRELTEPGLLHPHGTDYTWRTLITSFSRQHHMSRLRPTSTIFNVDFSVPRGRTDSLTFQLVALSILASLARLCVNLRTAVHTLLI